LPSTNKNRLCGCVLGAAVCISFKGMKSNSFFDFIRHSSLNRLYGWAALYTSVFVFFIFKQFYPYPNMVMDSYVYIKAATLDMGANSFPIGYSRFLQFFHFFSSSAAALTWFQYLFLEASCLYFLYTLLFWFRPHNWISHLLFVFLFLNPLFPYLANFVMADTLFTSLSLLWLTQLIWIIFQPRPYLVITQALILLFAFTVRYNALYYPFFSTITILFARWRLWLKLSAIAFQFLLIGAFISYTKGEMKDLTGISQFSPFGGWKLANDALYMYGHIYKEDPGPVPAKFQQVDSMVRRYFTRTGRVDGLERTNIQHGSFYMTVGWGSPLFQYMYWRYGIDTTFQDFRKWGPTGAFLGAYGSWLVRRHPLEFSRYYVAPNLLRYGCPPTEVFGYLSPYYLPSSGFGSMAANWFHLTTLTVPGSYINFRTSLLSMYPIFIALTHVAFILGFLGVLIIGRFRTFKSQTKKVFLTIALLWLLDMGFSASASGIVMRYLVFSHIMELAFALLFLDLIYYQGEIKTVR
jgi:hypothetical protein